MRIRRSPRRDAASEYRADVELVKTARHDEAIPALRAFIAKHPHHDYADNAQYWIGEAFYAQKDYARALTEFRAVIEVYPRGNKVPDALLKVGYCYVAMGQGEKARAVLEQVVNLYRLNDVLMASVAHDGRLGLFATAKVGDFGFCRGKFHRRQPGSFM